MKVNFGLSVDETGKIAQILTALLADIHQLYIKNLGYHWNVEDPRFLLLHELFEQGYTELASDLDQVAERIRKLGHLAPQSVEELIAARRLKDTQKVASGDQMVDALATDYEHLMVSLRADIQAISETGDEGTVDMLIGLLRQYEKRAWFLRSHL